MRIRLLRSIAASMVIASVLVAARMAPPASAEAPALKTPWGEPDLQGIWTDETDTPLQRAAKYATQEFFTGAQREELDKERSALLGRNKRVERGTELDVAGAYNAGVRHVDQAHRRAHLDGGRSAQRPDSAAVTPQGHEDRLGPTRNSWRLALLQATETCKAKSVACNGGKYDPTLHRGAALELPAR